MKKLQKLAAIALAASMTCCMLAGCSSGNGETVTTEGTVTTAAAETTESAATAGTENSSESGTHIVTDATGREVEVPDHPQKIAIGAMVLPNMVYALQGTAENIYSIPPAAYSGWEIGILKDLAPELEDVDTTMCGDDYSVNVEALAEAGVDLVLNWDSETDSAEQLEAVGIPCVLVSSAKNMESLETLIGILGEALNCQDRANEVLDWYSETLSYFDSKQDQVTALSDDQKPRVLHFQNVNNMKVYAKGMNPSITELEGGQNLELAAEVTEPTMEDLIAYDPEIIFISNFDDVTPDDFYNNTIEGQDWSAVSAVKNHQVYKVPVGLYRWAPPNTFEKPLYMLWTAQIVQPEIFNDYDFTEKLKDFYSSYYNYELTDEQVASITHADLNANSK